MNERIKIIIFDLDGTIYQDFSFYKQYIHFMVEGTQKEDWEERLIGFAEDVLCGKRLKMNAFYRCAAINAEDPRRYCDLAEKAIVQIEAADASPAPDGVVNLGDAWAVVTFMGYSLGLFDAARCQRTYQRTRRAMLGSGLRGNTELREAIAKANTRCETALLSNSDAESATELLNRLGFGEIFGKRAFSVEKPQGLVEAVHRFFPAALEEPESVLAVGDHAYNDLEPLRRAGCRTLWMNPYPDIAEPPHDVCLNTLGELAEYLNGLCS